jgi:phosphatidate cytidylyltransferase
MSFPSNLLGVALATLLVLLVGTIVRFVSLRGAARDVRLARLGSLVSWWVVVLLILGCAILGRTAGALLFTLIGLLTLREFVSLFPDIHYSRLLLGAAGLLIPLNYLWIWLRWELVFLLFLPLTTALLLGSLQMLTAPTDGFVRKVASLQWLLLVTVYALSHAVRLFDLPSKWNTAAGKGDLFLYLLLLTEGNDIAQALTGRAIGRLKLVPQLSPRKTWEGLFGGFAATGVLAILLAPWLTPLNLVQAAILAPVLSIVGTLGDFNMSAVKRDAGVKDSGLLFPGQGGILDRIDSLTFTAPVFFYWVSLLKS